ncbi:ubiquinol-cytochrome C chaperone family protein [Aestuariispira ectoiniformans]|uniref:ubiquinol-cytochrome C chaperone family protein n=1 Tax=Aestuariispira ectoiniformans TaxID=2775080 RepID=UPI00223ADBE7|nr:ubiquinol-cytochrome C chaperone family protein [Aestuariispira ectoiniformans]
MVFKWAKRVFTASSDEVTAERLYLALVEQSRQHAFYAEYGVSDSVDGRFDMIAVHLFLILDRLHDEAKAAGASQALVNRVVADMDNSLREMGVGDMSVGKKVQTMAKALYGRLEAYSQGFDEEDNESLVKALERNVYRSEKPVGANAVRLAAYMRRQAAVLAEQSVEEFLAGHVQFADEGEAE